MVRLQKSHRIVRGQLAGNAPRPGRCGEAAAAGTPPDRASVSPPPLQTLLPGRAGLGPAAASRGEARRREAPSPRRLRRERAGGVRPPETGPAGKRDPSAPPPPPHTSGRPGPRPGPSPRQAAPPTAVSGRSLLPLMQLRAKPLQNLPVWGTKKGWFGFSYRQFFSSCVTKQKPNAFF